LNNSLRDNGWTPDWDTTDRL